MSQMFSVAVVGATGLVGEALVGILEERAFPVSNLHLLASADSAGKALSFAGRQVRVKAIDGFDFSHAQLVFLCAKPDVSRQLLPQMQVAGCAVIDLTAAFELSHAPALMPSMRAESLWQLGQHCLLSCPTQIASPVALVLQVLSEQLQLVSVDVTAMLSASSQGRAGVQLLARQTTELLNGRPVTTADDQPQRAFNVIDRACEVATGVDCSLELRSANELRQLLEKPDLSVSVGAALLPVFFGDSINLTVQSASPIDLAKIGSLLADAEGIEWVSADELSSVADAIGQDDVFVSRVRSTANDFCRLNLWIASDNVRKGSALNAVQIAELLIKPYL